MASEDTSYDVLYYKRTQKVHKSRGVSKVDGVLTLVHGTGRVLLCSAAAMDQEDDSASSEEETKKMSWKEKQKKRKRSKPSSSPTVYSGIQHIAIAVDTTIQLGGYEVEVIALRGMNAQQDKPLPKPARFPLQKKLMVPSKRFIKQKRPLQPKKLPAQPKLVPSSAPTIPKSRPDIQKIDRASAHVQPAMRSACLPRKPMLGSQGQGAKTPSSAILPHIPLPMSIRSVLRPHQVSGIEFLWNTLQEKHGCILGDEMGLGKTLMTISCIVALHRTQREKHFVVVCPSSLTVNWANEFDKWLGKASQPKRVVIQKGGAEGLSQIRAYTSRLKRHVANQSGQVLIVSYDLFRRNTKEFDFPSSVHLLVVDEGHKLKNTNGSQTLAALQGLKSDARLCITATPIQNNLREFYQLADFCCPGIIGTDLSAFVRDFERPIAAANQKCASHTVKLAGRAKSKELQEITDTFLVRRLQKDILKTMLPPRTEVLLFCRPQKSQRVSYQQLAQSACSNPLVLLTSLQKLCCHPRLVLESNCGKVSFSGKLSVLDALLQHISRMGNEKVVIVSQFTSVLKCIEEQVMKNHGYSFGRLDGSTVKRQNVVDTFQNTSQFCLLLSSKAGGCGLNLVKARRMILFDPCWNPSNDIQAMGRIYRQGQSQPCFIYRLFTTGTLEEVIYQRQILKGGLSTMTLDARTKKHSTNFTDEELRDCFTLRDVNCDTKNKMSDWPEYDGPSTLRSQGCFDAPLLEITANLGKEILSHVHIVNETEDHGLSNIEESETPCSVKDDSDSDSYEHEF